MEAIKFLDPPPCRRDSRSTLAVTVSPPQLDWFFFQLTLLLTPGCFQVLQLGNCVSTCSYSKPPPSVKTLRHTKDLSCTRHLSSWSCPTPLPPSAPSSPSFLHDSRHVRYVPPGLLFESRPSLLLSASANDGQTISAWPHVLTF